MPAENSASTDRSWLRRFVIWPSEAAVLAVLFSFFAVLPRRVASWVGGVVTAFLGPLVSRQHVRAIRRNLAIAFPELTARESAALQHKIWRHLGRVLSNHSHLPPLLRRPGFDGVIEIEGAEHLVEAARSGPFLIVGAHFGHLELTGCHAALTGHRISGLYTPEGNPWVDRLIRQLRGRASTESELIARGPTAVRQMIECLRRGHGLFMVVDQRVDDGEWLSFFGQPAQTTTAPARLARRFDCPILLGRAILLPKGRYRISYYKPLRPDPAREADADIFAMTQAINDTFEAWIREYPEQWLCTKRRWPKYWRASNVQSRQPAAEDEPTRARIPAKVD